MLIKKVHLNVLVCLVLFSLLFLTIINTVEPPANWQNAPIELIFLVFLSLLGILTCLVRLLVPTLRISFLIGLAGLFLLVLHALDQLNWISGIVVFGVFGMLVIGFLKHRLTIRSKDATFTSINNLHSETIQEEELE